MEPVPRWFADLTPWGFDQSPAEGCSERFLTAEKGMSEILPLRKPAILNKPIKTIDPNQPFGTVPIPNCGFDWGNLYFGLVT